jgi:hypothetical protein
MTDQVIAHSAAKATIHAPVSPSDLTECGSSPSPTASIRPVPRTNAAIAIVLTRELGFPEEIVNVEGAVVAHGHPIGATGAVLTSSFTRCGATGSSVALSRFASAAAKASRLRSKPCTEASSD